MKNTSTNSQITLKTAPRIDVNMISDSTIEEEFVKRFTLSSGDKITSSTDSVNHIRTMFTDKFKEQFVVIYLNGQNQVIASEVLFEGSLTTSAVYPREVIRRIIELGSAAIIMAHNHPSGNPNPSNDDIKITRKLIDACKTIDVVIHDHIIIAGITHTSFADKGLM